MPKVEIVEHLAVEIGVRARGGGGGGVAATVMKCNKFN